MADLTKYRNLTDRERAIVAVAVLLDGHDAGTYLEHDRYRGEELARAADDLSQLPPDLRVPFVGTALRRALSLLETVVTSRSK